MKKKSIPKAKKQESFTPHYVAINRVKRSFDRAKNRQSESSTEFVEVK
ncbi:TPA: hypothetical protein NJ448_004537 [Vibrio parahaemolyticus]|nr:hypothetical protein [Vibrio parahaemolyticus]MBE4057613.1 hypothetical protein [Vibrio parahaemolyticus]MBE4267686.1 hypothetical protein [Vibrio parahaemolyticus]MBE4358873.1 hypothetical protein [Vibrio parahaemolyticus]HCG5547969.1 hypothetical protein [Vibrio parahaemolyticus]HCG7634400.1 hypothetical protein [Vibrio parahaemolyticus]